MPRQNTEHGSSRRPGLPLSADPSPGPACGRRRRTEGRPPEAGKEGVFIARGVVWLGVPEGSEERKSSTVPRRPEPALQLLGYAHGPGILDRVRSGGR